MKHSPFLMVAAALAAIVCSGCPEDAVLNVSPSVRQVAAPAGTTTFTISNSGDGMMAWQPTVTAGEEWLHLDSAVSNTLTVRFDGNATPDAREGEISIDAFGATGSPAVVAVVQAGASGQGNIDLVGTWDGVWWFSGTEGTTQSTWAFATDGTWSLQTPSTSAAAEGTYVVDLSATPHKIDIYASSSSAPGTVAGTTYRGYYEVVNDTLHLSQVFETRLEWSNDLLDPDQGTVFVGD